MKTKLTTLLLAALMTTGWTSYSVQGPTLATGRNLREAIPEIAAQIAEGRRVEVAAGDAAPFDGVLLDDAALALLRGEVDSLRREVALLRAALEAQQTATEIERTRADMWKAEKSSSVWGRISGYGWAVCGGILAGAAVAR